MAFCCKMDDTINILILHELIECVKVADVHLHELVVWLIFYIFEVGKVASVSEFVEIDNLVLRVFINEEAHYMTAYKASSTCDDNVSFEFHIFLLFL